MVQCPLLVARYVSLHLGVFSTEEKQSKHTYHLKLFSVVRFPFLEDKGVGVGTTAFCVLDKHCH